MIQDASPPRLFGRLARPNEVIQSGYEGDGHGESEPHARSFASSLHFDCNASM